MVVIGEDSRFWTHHGLDPVEMADALGIERGRGVWSVVQTVWRRRDRMRGASTITQQLAKNLYPSPSRSLFRKVKEAVTAVRLELALPKARILELYLNVAEWGPGIWGASAASRSYFGVPPSQLSARQAAALAATLPHPRSSNPAYQSERMLARRDLILARYRGVDVYVPPEMEEPPEQALDSLTVLPAVADSVADSVVADSLGMETVDSTGMEAGDSMTDTLSDSTDQPR
jgi:monofunctional biosynthetic peptidoglycan transglycosylase